MKRKLIKYILVVFFITCVEGLIAQPPPPPGDGHGASNNQVPGGGAPVGNGTLLLIGLAGAYAIFKRCNLRTEKSE
jgi:hypothetical protein